MFGGDPEMDPQSRSSVQEGVDTSFQSDIFIGSEKSSENEWKLSCNTYPRKFDTNVGLAVRRYYGCYSELAMSLPEDLIVTKVNTK